MFQRELFTETIPGKVCFFFCFYITIYFQRLPPLRLHIAPIKFDKETVLTIFYRKF